MSQAGPSQLQLPAHQSKENRTFSNNYNRLTNLLQRAWIPDFVAAGIITANDANNIDGDPNPKLKMLNRVSESLQAYNSTPFYAMLSIMQNKEAAAKELADEILAELATTRDYEQMPGTYVPKVKHIDIHT